MSLPELKQASSLIERSSRILLAVPERASIDAVASMIAIYLALEPSKGNNIDEVNPGHVPLGLQFLPGSSQVHMQPRRQTEIVLDVAGSAALSDVRTETLQGGIRLHLSLSDGETLSKDQVELSIRSLPYDLAILFGASDVEALGSLFSENTDFFYNTPIINIDHRADNEYFGTVNLVDITAGSIAEVAYDLISNLANISLDAGIATALYAGIVAGTDSFQRPSTTPRSFEAAAKLMNLHADREAVIQHLVKTKPLSLLKLTGRLYARLRYDEHLQAFWSLIRPLDFAESGAEPADLPRAMRELSNNIAAFNAAFVLSEHSAGEYEMHLMLGKGLLQRREEIQASLSATRDNGLLHIKLPANSFEEAEAQALEKVRGIVP